MNRFVLLAAGLSMGVLHAHALADTWCSLNYPTAAFCDDFDRYCSPLPPAPQACDAGSSADGGSMQDVWRYGYGGAVPCSQILLDTDFETSPPYAAKSPNQEGGSLARAQVSLEPFFQAAFGSEYTAVMATDANPLILEYAIHMGTVAKATFANNYMELALGTNQASTDYRWSPTCCGSSERYPIICQQAGAPADCASLSTAPHAASLAVGALAYLDTDPCHCSSSGIHSPYNTHLSFFDGHQWRILTQGLYPGAGDFQLRAQNRIRLTITTLNVKVELTCTDPNPDEYSWCNIPRDYLGPFSKLYAGFKAFCQLKSGKWECQLDPNCTVKGVPGGGVPRYDNVAVSGGIGYAPPGACCLPDLSCLETLGGLDCQTHGGQFSGSGTTCETTVCCQPFLPDRNTDSDVDQEDFGWFQTCLAGIEVPVGSCTCADFNHDDRVDQSDWLLFLGCMSGPDHPANPNCLN